MTAAFAPPVADVSTPHASAPSGAQNLLALKPARQFYLAEALAIVLYALALYAGLYYKSPPIEVPPEEPIELVMVPAEEPPPPPPLPEVVPPQPEEPPPPPPPAAIEPPIAPVEPIKPKPIVKPKPLPKPIPKVEPKIQPKPQPVHERVERVERKPQPVAPQHVVRAPAAPAPARPVPAGASASAIANQIHGCLQRAGSNYDSHGKSGRVAYRANISASGSVSYSFSSSGNSQMDAAARGAASRCGHVDAPGHAAAFSGIISFR